MMKKYGKGRIKAVFLALFMCFGMFVQAQMELQAELDIDKEHDIENDNRLYFHDIALERGVYFDTRMNSDLSDGFVTSLYGSHFLTHNLGVRSGISLITYLKDDSPYLKIPCLFAFRTPTFHFSNWEAESFGEFLFNLFLAIIPTRCEVNLGPSIGYVWNNQRNFASSIDGNLRLGFQIWRIGINGNMGVNCLWTRNFIDKDSINRFRPAWFVGFSGGVSFRF
ncbi:MAG: hypothetical protein LBS43_10120 [Prevotellaceae bacterium]|jgi:hypothetical protein|nr:hypothetical protein [Prevotellaceae bacterium]